MMKYIVTFLVSFMAVLGWWFAVDMSEYVVFPHYCHEDPFSGEFVCQGDFAVLKARLDNAMDPFLDDYTTVLFEKYDSDLDAILDDMDALRDRVGSFSADPDLSNTFLFVVEYVYYKISRAMEEIS